MSLWPRDDALNLPVITILDFFLEHEVRIGMQESMNHYHARGLKHGKKVDCSNSFGTKKAQVGVRMDFRRLLVTIYID